MSDGLERLLAVDRKITSSLHLKNPPKIFELFLKFISHSCDSWYWMIGLIVLWALSNHAGKKFAVITAFVTGTLAFLVLLIKFLIRRKRPDGEWGQVYRLNDPHSFPSGHAARAFAILIVVRHLLPWWVVIIVAVWAALVAYSRVALKLHYFSDIWVGGFIGGVYAALAINLFGLLMDIFPKVAQILFHGF